MLALTPVTVNRRLVVDRAGNVTVTPAPALSNAGTATEPSENVNVPAVTWSDVFGRSNNTTEPTVTGPGQLNCNQLPALPAFVAHSLE